MYASVALPLVPLHEEQWAADLESLQRMGADRALLFMPLDNICRTPVAVKKSVVGDELLQPLPHQETNDTPSLELYRIWSELLRERVRDLDTYGIEAAAWLGHTIGHGGSLSAGGSPGFQPIVGPEGIEAQGCYCPLDPTFAAYIGEAVAILAQSGVSLVLLDDDFRLHSHKPNALVGCFCPLHLQAFEQKTGLSLTREELVQRALQGKPSAIRQAWLEVLGESLLGFAEAIEQAVHAVNPATRIGLATAMTLWSNEGVDMQQLVRTLAGGTKPFLRTIGAPYWVKEPAQTGWVVELTRLQQHWASNWGIELAAEGDTFPHTRYFCSAAVLRAYQRGLHASGFPGMIHYPVVYSPPSNHEPAYVQLQEASRPAFEALSRFFPAHYRDVGVMPVCTPNNFAHVVMPEDAKASLVSWPDEPVGLRYLSRLGIPIAYDDETGPVLLSGYGAAGLPEEELQHLLDRGAMLDATAARWLAERGIDIGITASEPGHTPKFERYHDADFSGRFTGHPIWLLTPGSDIYTRFQVKSEARTISSFEGNDDAERYSAAFLYEDDRGRRFCILAFDFFQAKAGMQLVYNYARQEQLTRCFAWLNHRPLAAVLNGCPDVNLLCRMEPDGSRLAIGIHNHHLDPITNPVIRLAPDIAVRRSIELLQADHEHAEREFTAFDYVNDGEYGYLSIHVTIPAMGMLSVGLPQDTEGGFSHVNDVLY